MALDLCHPQVVKALQTEGWQVGQKPVRLASLERTVYIDIRASRPYDGKQEHVFMAEVKCFADSRMLTYDVYTAVGQYLLYREVIEAAGLLIPLYLTIPDDVYDSHFDEITRRVMARYQINAILVNIETEKVKQWITQVA